MPPKQKPVRGIGVERLVLGWDLFGFIPEYCHDCFGIRICRQKICNVNIGTFFFTSLNCYVIWLICSEYMRDLWSINVIF